LRRFSYACAYELHGALPSMSNPVNLEETPPLPPSIYSSLAGKAPGLAAGQPGKASQSLANNSRGDSAAEQWGKALPVAPPLASSSIRRPVAAKIYGGEHILQQNRPPRPATTGELVRVPVVGRAPPASSSRSPFGSRTLDLELHQCSPGRRP
jgi:hypothetical protein